MRWLPLACLLFALPAWADTEESPNGSSGDGQNQCNPPPSNTWHTRVNDDPDSPDGTLCRALNTDSDWSVWLNMTETAGPLDEGTDAQVFAIFVRERNETSTGTAHIRIDVRDGTNCADLHGPVGADQVVPSFASGGAILTHAWDATGVSSVADVCVALICLPDGPGGLEQSCDLDAVEWRAAEAASIMFIIQE